MLEEGKDFWLEAMQPYTKEDQMVVMIGRPSKKKLKDMKEEDKNFIDNRIKDLGRDGLEAKGKLLEESKVG